MKRLEIPLVLFLMIAIVVGLYSTPTTGRWYEFRVKKISSTGAVQADTINGRHSINGKRVPGNGLEADTAITITGLGRDTTRVYTSMEFMTFAVLLMDQIALDSADIDFLIYRGSMASDRVPPYEEFTLEDSLNFNVDSTWTRKVYTTAGSDRANSKLWFGVLKGNANNRKLTGGVKVLIRFEGYNSDPELR